MPTVMLSYVCRTPTTFSLDASYYIYIYIYFTHISLREIETRDISTSLITSPLSHLLLVTKRWIWNEKTRLELLRGAPENQQPGRFDALDPRASSSSVRGLPGLEIRSNHIPLCGNVLSFVFISLLLPSLLLFFLLQSYACTNVNIYIYHIHILSYCRI